MFNTILAAALLNDDADELRTINEVRGPMLSHVTQFGFWVTLTRPVHRPLHSRQLEGIFMDVDKTYTNRSNIVTLFIETCTLVYPSGYVSAGDALRSRSDFDASTSCGPPLRAFTFPLTPVGDLTSISGPYRRYEMPWALA